MVAQTINSLPVAPAVSIADVLPLQRTNGVTYSVTVEQLLVGVSGAVQPPIPANPGMFLTGPLAAGGNPVAVMPNSAGGPLVLDGSGHVSGSIFGQNLSAFSTVAALLAATNYAAWADGSTVLVTGYASADDGMGFEGTWYATSTATADGGITFNPTGNTGAGRIVRRFMGAIQASFFGASPSASGAVNAAAINAALALGTTVEISGGYFSISAPITIPQGSSLRSNSRYGTALVVTGLTSAQYAITIAHFAGPTSPIPSVGTNSVRFMDRVLDNITLIGNATSPFTNGVLINGNNMTISCSIAGFIAGLTFGITDTFQIDIDSSLIAQNTTGVLVPSGTVSNSGELITFSKTKIDNNGVGIINNQSSFELKGVFGSFDYNGVAIQTVQTSYLPSFNHVHIEFTYGSQYFLGALNGGGAGVVLIDANLAVPENDLFAPVSGTPTGNIFINFVSCSPQNLTSQDADNYYTRTVYLSSQYPSNFVPVSGTNYTNSLNSWLDIYLPCTLTPTSSAEALVNVTLFPGSNNHYSGAVITGPSVAAGGPTSTTPVFHVRIPPGASYQFGALNATFGTAQVFAF